MGFEFHLFDSGFSITALLKISSCTERITCLVLSLLLYIMHIRMTYVCTFRRNSFSLSVHLNNFQKLSFVVRISRVPIISKQYIEISLIVHYIL